jgi:hypothetical protein
MNDDAVHNGAGGTTGLSGMPGSPGVSGGPHRSWVVALVCGVLPAALLAVIVAVPAALWSRLPGRVADHWTITGTANGTAPRLAALVTLGVLAIAGTGVTWLGWASARKGTRPRGRATAVGGAATITAGLFVAALATASVIMLVVANLGGGGVRSASVGVAGLAGIFCGPAGLAFLAGWALRRFGGLGAADAGEQRSSLGLRAGERAVWTGRARAGRAGPAGVLLLAGGLLAGFAGAQWTPGAALLAAGVAMLGFTSVRVTVAARGVTVGYGALGLRLTRIPLRRIASAAAVEQTARAFGYRGNLHMLGSAAVVLRRGPALRLTLRDGRTFLVTVDDATTGAALLNDLITAATWPGDGGREPGIEGHVKSRTRRLTIEEPYDI